MNCGFYEREITPPIGAELPGQYERRVSTGVLDRLYAKAVVFSDGERAAALLVLDAVGLPDDFCAAIRARVRELTGLAEEEFVVCATHTHQGLPTGEPIGSSADPGFLHEVGRVAADCVVLAMRRMEPCRLSFTVGCVDGISFVRDYLREDGSIRTNPGHRVPLVRPYSEADPDLPTMYVHSENGAMMGVIYGFACHQDCVGGTEFTGDYSSEVSRQIKAQYGQDTVSIYITAASGDINNIDYMTDAHPVYHWYRPNYLEMGRRIAAELIHAADKAKPLPEDPIRARRELVPCTFRRAPKELVALAEECVRTGQKIPHAMLAGTRYAELLLQYERQRSESGETQKQAPVQVLRIGGITLYAMPGEMYHQFGTQLKQAVGGRCLVATLSGGEFGYFPTPEMFETEVYPAQLCGGSMFTPETGAVLTERAIEMLQDL